MQDMERWNTRCAFLMIDLDRFKAVNDTLGHPIGDRLLARVAERLRHACSSNEICGRLGGDEFAVVIREVHETSYVERLAIEIIEALSRPYEVDQHTLYIGASVGRSEEHTSELQSLMRISYAVFCLKKKKNQTSHI